MYKIREDIKDSLRAVGKTMTQLSIALGINYDSLNHVLNGRRQLPESLESRIASIISEWNNV